MIPVYSSSAIGSIAAPKNPWRRMPMLNTLNAGNIY